MNQFINKKVQVGQKVVAYSGQQLGHGLYVHHDVVYASVIGLIRRTATDVYFVESNFPVRCVGIRIGDIVYGEISKIKEEEAFVSIIQVNGVAMSRQIEGTIRKEHVREKLTEQVVISECYRPGDIIKAQVISLGDSSRSLYLTTAGQELGVLVAQNQLSGGLMLPYDWTSMIDPKTGQHQKRKVGRPEM